MKPAEPQSSALARRLRALREDGLAGQSITQKDLAEALNTSISLISSWESKTNPQIPPQKRVEAYAAFFSTDRSVAKKPFRVLSESQLTSVDRIRRDQLFRELTELRNAAQSPPPSADSSPDGGFWQFTPGQSITIVCSELPPERLRQLPYTDPEEPDFVELYRYADLDALLELHGYIRAVNPRCDVNVRAPSKLDGNEYTTHLVLLGGVDWNVVTEELLRRLDLPVRQLARADELEQGGFEVVDEGKRRLIAPVLRKAGKRDILVEDVAHFYRAPNPFNDRRTVTICNGMYGRGTYGAVRTLTDTKFRDRNSQYIRTRFVGLNTFSVISRVLLANGKVVTPDWTRPENQLHEWPMEPA